jgi:hypothetical protein
MAKSFKVSSQGIAKDLSSATGSYDTIEHGVISSDALYETLQKFKAIKEIVPQGNEDICPPSLYVDNSGTDYSFYLSEGEIINLNTEVKMSPMEIVNLVSGFTTKKEVAEEAFQEEKSKPAAENTDGKKKRSALAWGSDHPEIKGMQPVRKKDLAPTDKENWSGFNMDTKNSPQISAEIYKSDSTAGLPLVAFIFGVMFGVLALGSFVNGDITPGLVFLVIASALIWLKGFLKSKVRGEFNLGFDWKANAMWSKIKGEKRAIMVANANCIASIELYEHTTSRPYRWNAGDSGMQKSVRQSVKDKKWILEAVMSNGERRFAFEFYDKNDAQDVLGKAQILLTQQN